MQNKKITEFNAIQSIKRAVRDTSTARLAAESIIADICARQDLGREWERIAPDVQHEIANTWTKIIEIILDDNFCVNDILNKTDILTGGGGGPVTWASGHPAK